MKSVNVNKSSDVNQSFLDTARRQIIKAGEKTSKIFGFVVLNSTLGGIPGIMLTKAHLANLKSIKDASPRNTNVVSSMVTTAKQKSQTDKAINESPQCRHDPKKMMKYLCARHGTEKVRAFIENATDSNTGTCRFNGDDDRFEFNPTELLDALKEIEEKQGDHTVYVSDNDSEDSTNVDEQVSYSNSIKNDLQAELVAFVERKEIQVGVEDDSGNEVGVVKQNSGHMDYAEDGVGEFHQGFTPSAELPNAKKIGNVVNQAYVTYDDKTTNKKEVLMCRSGRTDTPEKIKDKSAGDIVTRAMASKRKGDNCLKAAQDKDGNKYFEYRRTDTTLMDTALLKSGFTLAKGALFNLGKETPLEAERLFVENKQKAVKNTWDESKCSGIDEKGPYILHKLNVDGSDITVREYKPLVFQFVFSSQANTTSNLEAARKANLPSTLELGRLFAKEVGDTQLENCIKAYQEKPNAKNKEDLEKQLKNSHASVPAAKLRNKYALEGLYAMLTGVSMKGNSIDTIEGTGQQFLYASLLSEIAGVAIGAECKSGNDRTIAAVSLLSASKELEKINGEPFNPADVRGDNADFKPVFTKYMIMLGEPNVMASRGVAEGDKKKRPVLKTKTHPLAQLLTTDNNGKGIKAKMPATGGQRYQTKSGKSTCSLDDAVLQK